jgi:hypothetical protein
VRQFLVRLQIYSEMAVLLNDLERGLQGIERVVELGLLDITWMDACPLLSKVADHPRFTAQRRIVAERARGVLTAFQAVSTHS